MKYPCEMIKDLLPLYADNVCSDRSKRIVEEHLHECADCYKYCEELIKAGTLAEVSAHETDEAQMAESLKKVKKAILYKKIAAVIATVAVIALIITGTIGYLTQSFITIPYQNNITVNQSVPQQYQSVQGQDYLSAEFTGNTVVWASQKRVDIEIDGTAESIIYFFGQTSRWEDIIADENTITYHLISPINRDNDITKVYYYTGDKFDRLEEMTAQELKEINRQAVLLWEKTN